MLRVRKEGPLAPTYPRQRWTISSWICGESLILAKCKQSHTCVCHGKAWHSSTLQWSFLMSITPGTYIVERAWLRYDSVLSLRDCFSQHLSLLTTKLHILKMSCQVAGETAVAFMNPPVSMIRLQVFSSLYTGRSQPELHSKTNSSDSNLYKMVG